MLLQHDCVTSCQRDYDESIIIASNYDRAI